MVDKSMSRTFHIFRITAIEKEIHASLNRNVSAGIKNESNHLEGGKRFHMLSVEDQERLFVKFEYWSHLLISHSKFRGINVVQSAMMNSQHGPA